MRTSWPLNYPWDSSARRATGAAIRVPYYQARLAEAYGKNNQPEEGLALIEKALAVIASSGELWWEAEIYRLKGELLLTQEIKNQKSKIKSQKSETLSTQPPAPSTQAEVAQEVEGLFLKAIEIAQQQQAKSLELRATTSLSRLRHQQKKKNTHKMLLAVYGWFTEGLESKDLQEAKLLIQELRH
jgi:predicted ATPase